MNASLFVSVSLIVFVLLDIYTFQSLKTLTSNRWIRRLWWIIHIAGYSYIIISALAFDPTAEPRKVLNTYMIWLVLMYVPKFVWIAFLLLEDAWRLIVALFRAPAGLSANSEVRTSDAKYLPSRRTFVQQMALAATTIPFLGIAHGIWKGKFAFRVIKQTLTFPDLPEAFDGFKILQVSDIHSGSFDDREAILEGVKMINDQKADLFLFTGDLVNNKAEEMKDWMDVFSRIRAPFGQFSVLGNHDYGDYVHWESDAAKEQNMQDLYRVHDELGFTLLRNQSMRIEKDGQHFDLLGVENWGNPPFPQKGDLKATLANTTPGSFKVLMSHDPTHFDEKVVDEEEHIHLTLSGHTHGMQFGIEIPGWIKWSPVEFKYPKWAGLYEVKSRYLYVNRGFGYLAFPGRVGIWPEITLIELKKQTA